MPLAQSGGSNVGSSQIIDNEIIDADINAAAGIAISKINFGTGINSSKIDAGVVQVAEIAISSAEFLAGFTKDLVAAPGAGKIVIPEFVVFRGIHGGTSYAAGNTCYFRWNGSTVDAIPNLSPTIVTAATDTVSFQTMTGGQSYAIVANINKAFQFTTNGASFTTGNGTAKVFIKYRIITL